MTRLASIAVAVFWAVYYGLLLSGVTAIAPISEPLYAPPLLVASFLFILISAADLYLTISKKGMPGMLWLVGITLLCAGYWVGSFMSYDSSVVITEGQVVQRNYLKETVKVKYSGKYAKVPDIVIKLVKLKPKFSGDGTSLDGLNGSFEAQEGGKDVNPFNISMSQSHDVGGFSVSMSGFGYSPRFELYDNKGNFVDSSFVYLKLFPPGTEDYFRILAPLTYYVRYYPGGTDKDSSAHYAIRVARNKDLVFEGDVRPGERFSFENAEMSFPEIRMWTMLRLRRNPGKPLLYLAMVTLAISVFMQARRKRTAAR